MKKTTAPRRRDHDLDSPLKRDALGLGLGNPERSHPLERKETKGDSGRLLHFRNRANCKDLTDSGTLLPICVFSPMSSRSAGCIPLLSAGPAARTAWTPVAPVASAHGFPAVSLSFEGQRRKREVYMFYWN